MTAAILTAAVVYVVMEILKYVREKSNDIKEFDVNYVTAIIEEAVCHAETKYKIMKRETAHGIGMSVRKMSPETIKNPIEVEKILNTGMLPIREMCQKEAYDYIDTLLKNTKYARLMPIMNQAIKMRVDAAKLQINDPLRAMIYRGMNG